MRKFNGHLAGQTTMTKALSDTLAERYNQGIPRPKKPIGETCPKAKHAIGLSNRRTRFVASFRKTKPVKSRMSQRRSHNDLATGVQAGFQEAEDRVNRSNRRSGSRARLNLRVARVVAARRGAFREGADLAIR
jgi:hypothetical protein